MTPDQLRDAFVADFQELLRRYNADFHIVDRGGDGYNPDNTAEIYFNGEWDEEGNTIRKPSEFYLIEYVNALTIFDFRNQQYASNV